MNFLEVLLLIGVVAGVVLLTFIIQGIDIPSLYFSVFSIYIVGVLLYSVINQVIMSKLVENSEKGDLSAGNSEADEYTYTIMPAGDPMSAEDAREWLDGFLVKQQGKESKK